MICIKKVTFQGICSVDPLWQNVHIKILNAVWVGRVHQKVGIRMLVRNRAQNQAIEAIDLIQIYVAGRGP